MYTQTFQPGTSVLVRVGRRTVPGTVTAPGPAFTLLEIDERIPVLLDGDAPVFVGAYWTRELKVAP